MTLKAVFGLVYTDATTAVLKVARFYSRQIPVGGPAEIFKPRKQK